MLRVVFLFLFFLLISNSSIAGEHYCSAKRTNYNDSIFSKHKIFNSHVRPRYSAVSIASDTIWEQVFEFKVVEYNEILSRRKNDTLIERARIEIETKLFNDPDAKGKDPFETTQEYLIRKNRLDEKRNQLIKERIDPLQKLNANDDYLFYRESPTNLFVDIQNWNYDADKQLWNISISNSALGEKVQLELSLSPTLAKQLWNSNNQWKFYKVNKYLNNGLEYFEWQIPIIEGKPGFSIILVKGNIYDFEKLEHPKVVKYIDVKEDEKPPEVEKLEKTKIGTVNQEGSKDEGIVAPPVESTVVEAPVQEDYYKVFQKVDFEAEFPGGLIGWTRYVTREIEKNIDELQKDKRSGTVVVLFIVDKVGAVSGVRALNCYEAGVGNCLPPNSKLAEIAVNAIRNGPKWKPAILNGRSVKAYRRQPVTFQLAEE